MNSKLLLLSLFIFISEIIFAANGVLSGAGTDANPYQIEDYADLKVVGTTATYTKAKVYQLKNNIDASLSASENAGLGFIPIGTLAAPFTGKILGSGKIISKLSIKRIATDYVGLIGYMNTSAVVDSIGIENSYIKGRNYVGAVAGYCKGSTVTNSHNTDSVISIISYAGGLIGYGETAIIAKCWNKGAVKSTSLYAAGIVGYTSAGSISDSYNIGSISSVESAGGIVGSTILGTTINNCYNKGTIYASSKYAGGIGGGTSAGTISFCTNYGKITSLTYQGGLIAYSSASIISNCNNVANITGSTYVGGLVGEAASGTISKCYNTGSCTGASFVGGFVGYASGVIISNSYSTGDVVGTASSIGGFVGQIFSATVDSCYSAGTFSGAANSAGFIGTNYDGTFLNTYFNTETTGTTKDIGFRLTPTPPITGLTIAQMKKSSSINMLDYTTIWDIRNDSIYPSLRTINNAPFAFPDTIRTSAKAITQGVLFRSCLNNDYDYETKQDSLVLKLKSVSNGTTDGISKMFFPASPQNGDKIHFSYRVGEKNALKPDTLWGNTTKSIILMDDKAPTFTVTNYSTNEDSITTFILKANDIDGDSISFSKIGSPIHGTITLNKDTLIYHPQANYNGLDSLQLIVSDGVLQNITWIKITLLPVNDAPVARDTLVAGVAGLPLKMKLPISDVDDSVFVAHTYKLPTHGTVTTNGDSIRYISNPYYTGNDTIQWFALDPGGLSSNTASLIVTLSEPTLSISHDSIQFRASGGEADSITVTSNTNWTTTSSESWVTVSPASAMGNNTLSIVVTENPDSIAREAIITIAAPGTSSKLLKIKQKGKTQLSVDNQLLTTYKVYDGTDTAAFIMGNILHIETEDIGKVNVTGIARYEDANAGNNKLLTVVYTLTGTAKGNYLTPKTDSVFVATIAPKQLSATPTSITTVKLFDGNASAQILSLGTLQGVESEDIGLVSLSATANYDNANVGANKTITVAYSLSGSAAANYLAPINEIITSGRIRDKVQLEVTNQLLSTNKIYDGTDTTAFTMGNILHIETEDIGKVDVTATARYADANAGNNKLLTVVYTLSGAAKEYYLPPLNESIVASIAPKQLSATPTTVVLSKMVDGNTSVRIVSLGALQGVESEDIGLVSLSAIAKYDNATVGKNKTITITYTLIGSAAANYKAPADQFIYAGEIEDNIFIKQLTDSLTSCGGAPIELSYDIQTGNPSEYQIIFDAKALSAGFTQIRYGDAPYPGSNGYISINILASAPFGKYTASLQFRNKLGAESALYPFSFNINVPSDYISLKSPTVLMVDTTANHFSAYQWYVDGFLIPYETGSIYRNMNGFLGTYQVSLKTNDGNSIYTCGKTIQGQVATDKTARVYPNPVHKNENLTIELSDGVFNQIRTATIQIFDPTGKFVYSAITDKEKTAFTFTHTTGLYVLHLTLDNGKKYTFNVLVIE